ncbi:MAG TPA: exonuclease domain-containing protein [Candidatus Peribacteraceae bacterium]|nr:exonuclease domain-containing protein [Candidatus Peribacteraceae bacterium]
MKLPDLSLLVLDTETTGFIPRVNRVIEFAAMRFEEGKLVDQYEQLISIPTAVPEVVSVLTRITDADLKGQPTMDEARAQILEKIPESALIVGQNVGFDLRMLKGEGIDLTERPWIDTSMLASLVFPELDSYSLAFVSQTLGLDHAPVHRALGDVRATTELLSRCWGRLLELTPALRIPLDNIMQRAPGGYRRFFSALPSSSAKNSPSWLVPSSKLQVHRDRYATWNMEHGTLSWLENPGNGVQLVEAPLDPDFMERIVAQAMTLPQPTWIAVKNVHATKRSLRIPAEVQMLQPASVLLDREAVVAFAKEPSYTADEATLALKLAWYEPETIADLPIHGDERAVWQGKLAATPQSKSYLQQFTTKAPVTLLNHWQLLRIAADETHPAYKLLPQIRIIIDDASMLEDTATKAYGYQCTVDYLRAAADQDEALTKFTDLLQIWMERTRNGQDVYYLKAGDVTSADAVHLRDRVTDVRKNIPDNAPVARLLDDILNTLNVAELSERIAYIETRQDGRQTLESVPSRVGKLLKKHLYDRAAVTLLIPPASDRELSEVLPADVQSSLVPMSEEERIVPMSIVAGRTLDTILENPPPGKTVIISSSRSRIEEMYIRHAASAEERHIALICQNLSGGMGRMQAEFCAAKGTVIWILTPWSFETAELPAGSIDHLFIETLPFDHPSHTILSKRAEKYQNAFAAYSLPRAKQRLYRLLRTFSHFRAPSGQVTLFDKRLEEKEYGRGIAAYLKTFTAPAESALTADTPKSVTEKPTKKSPRKAKKKEEQLPLF